ncbi:uncharacterized protein LOC144129465 [Amblyomma americanum]
MEQHVALNFLDEHVSVPPRSSVMVTGLSKTASQQMIVQLRNELIMIVDENHCIESSNCALRRWQNGALGEALAAAYSDMQWEAVPSSKKRKSDFEHGWALKDAVINAGHFNLTRMKALLHVTVETCKAEPPEQQPAYLLNADVLALEAEIRFKATMQDMERILTVVQQSLHRGDFVELDGYHRSKNWEFFLITQNIISMAPGQSMESTLIVCLAFYFSLDLSYPHTFGQTLGLVQTLLLQHKKFDKCLIFFKLKSLLKGLRLI